MRSSRTHIERLVEPLVLRTKREARRLSQLLAGFGFVVVVVLAIVMLNNVNPNESVHDDLLMLLMFFIWVGLIPALAVRYLMRRDLKTVPQIVSRGTSFAGRLEKHALGPSGMHHIRVVWEENGQPTGARFSAEGFGEILDNEVEVLALPKRRRVAVVIDGRLRVAIRDPRQYHLFGTR